MIVSAIIVIVLIVKVVAILIIAEVIILFLFPGSELNIDCTTTGFKTAEVFFLSPSNMCLILVISRQRESL